MYTSQWPGPDACGSSFKVLPNGTLSGVLETWKYSDTSGVHGLAFGAEGNQLYSADLSGDKVWTHAVGNDGKVSPAAQLPIPAGMHPRHLVAHSAGGYLYVVLEAGNAVVEYSLDEDTAAAKTQVNSYSVIPAGKLCPLRRLEGRLVLIVSERGKHNKLLVCRSHALVHRKISVGNSTSRSKDELDGTYLMLRVERCGCHSKEVVYGPDNGGKWERNGDRSSPV